MALDKRKLLAFYVESLREDVDLAHKAAHSAADMATHEESKPENKYDTRGLEASYLAAGHAKRIEDLKALILFFEQAQIPKIFSDAQISPWSLLHIRMDQKAQTVFILPKGIGKTLQLDGETVQIVTAQSPLGLELQNRFQGEEFEWKQGGKVKEIFIEEVV